MPNLDGTGPNGQGCQTGKKQGNCTNSNNSDSQNVFGQFRRWCRRHRWGRRRNGNGQGKGFGNGQKQ